MTFQIVALVQPQYAAATPTSYYVSPFGIATRIDAISVENTDTAPRTVSIYVVAAGGSASAANKTTNAQAILPGQSWQSPNEVGLVLRSGDFLAIEASVASKLVIGAGGLQQFG